MSQKDFQEIEETLGSALGTSRRSLLQQTAMIAGAATMFGTLVNAQGPGAAKGGAAKGGGKGAPGGRGGPGAAKSVELVDPKTLPGVAQEPSWSKLYGAGFRNERIKTTGGEEINAVIGGSGPPMLLMHGAPQSLCSWFLVAPEISKQYTMVMVDHRGYGDSSKPADKPDHSSQSKRPMAQDHVDVMDHFGFKQFRVVGHDRGGRVGRRMALDHPKQVQKLLTIDIVPAHYLYSHVTIEFVQAYAHWFNYLQRAPGPENDLITSRQAGAARAAAPAATPELEARALLNREYNRVFLLPGTTHAMCEDYRASASIDLKNDAIDIKAGHKIQCPVHVLWASDGAMGPLYDVLGIWKQEGKKVTGKGLTGGHSLQEGNPTATTAEILAFMKS